MNEFNKREKSFEKKFAKDEELKFKVNARSHKYLSEWVSLKLEKNDDDKQNYIQELIKTDMKEVGNEDVFRKVKKDFENSAISMSDSEIRNQMSLALERAKEDFK